MKKLQVKKEVLRKAKAIVQEDTAQDILDQEQLNRLLEQTVRSIDSMFKSQPMPVVSFLYPTEGKGIQTTRYVRVSEMNETHLKGFQIDHKYDEEPGVPRTFIVAKMDRLPSLLHLAK